MLINGPKLKACFVYLMPTAQSASFLCQIRLQALTPTGLEQTWILQPATLASFLMSATHPFFSPSELLRKSSSNTHLKKRASTFIAHKHNTCGSQQSAEDHQRSVNDDDSLEHWTKPKLNTVTKSQTVQKPHVNHIVYFSLGYSYSEEMDSCPFSTVHEQKASFMVYKFRK